MQAKIYLASYPNLLIYAAIHHNIHDFLSRVRNDCGLIAYIVRYELRPYIARYSEIQTDFCRTLFTGRNFEFIISM